MFALNTPVHVHDVKQQRRRPSVNKKDQGAAEKKPRARKQTPAAALKAKGKKSAPKPAEKEKPVAKKNQPAKARKTSENFEIKGAVI